MSSTKYIVTWHQGCYGEHDEGVAFWCDTEQEAEGAARLLNAEIKTIQTWYRAWCDENPWPRGVSEDEWRARRDATVAAYLAEHAYRAAGYLNNYSFRYGIELLHFDTIEVPRWVP